MIIIIANNSKEPLYQQIKRQIKAAIMKEEIKAGEKLPSIRTLANELEVSVITTKKVYEELEKEGFIISKVGIGTCVASKNMELIRESKKNMLENKIGEAVEMALDIGVTLEELLEMTGIIYGEEERKE